MGFPAVACLVVAGKRGVDSSTERYVRAVVGLGIVSQGRGNVLRARNVQQLTLQDRHGRLGLAGILGRHWRRSWT